MTLQIPHDPFLKDAEGASRFCRDLLIRMHRPAYQFVDWAPAIGWTARWSAHWAMRSRTWAAMEIAR